MIYSPFLYLIALLIIAFTLDSLSREKRGSLVGDAEEISGASFGAVTTTVAFLSCFLFISPGTLPPPGRGPFTAFALFAPLFLGSIFLESQIQSKQRLLDSGVAAATALLLAYNAIAIVLIKRGAPGDPFSLELFSSVHPTELFTKTGGAGLVLFFFCLLALLPPAHRDVRKGWGAATQLQRLCLLALMVRIFSVSSIASFWPIRMLAVLILDFIFFWWQVALLGLISNLYQKILACRIPKEKWVPFHAILLLGGVLLLAWELSYRF